MARSKSSNRWLREHFSDEFVQKAQKDGYRSRAVYKLEELQKKDKLIQPGMMVVDLGAAPGGWSQLAREYIGSQGRVIALDILPMDSLPDVDFIHGDFTQETTLLKLEQLLAGRQVDLVMSDMAPNMSGNTSVDIPKSMYLVELAIDFALNHLKPEGTFVSKVFHGEGFDDCVNQLKKTFTKLSVRKPKASRDRSRECYLVAKGRKV